MQDVRKAVWSIPYVSVVSFFPSLKQNFILYRSSKVSSRPDCIFEIPQLWQSGFSRMYSNCCCSCSFEAEIIKIGQSSYKMYSNNILNSQESTTILNAHTKKVWKCIVCTSYIYIYIVINRQTVSLYRNSSVWLDASSWDRNPPNFTLDLISYHSGDIRQLRNFKALCSSFRLFTFCLIEYQSDHFIRRTLQWVAGIDFFARLFNLR